MKINRIAWRVMRHSLGIIGIILVMAVWAAAVFFFIKPVVQVLFGTLGFMISTVLWTGVCLVAGFMVLVYYLEWFEKHFEPVCPKCNEILIWTEKRVARTSFIKWGCPNCNWSSGLF